MAPAPSYFPQVDGYTQPPDTGPPLPIFPAQFQPDSANFLSQDSSLATALTLDIPITTPADNEQYRSATGGVTGENHHQARSILQGFHLDHSYTTLSTLSRSKTYNLTISSALVWRELNRIWWAGPSHTKPIVLLRLDTQTLRQGHQPSCLHPFSVVASKSQDPPEGLYPRHRLTPNNQIQSQNKLRSR